MSILLDIVAMMWDPRAGRVDRSGVVIGWSIEWLGFQAEPFDFPRIRGPFGPFLCLDIPFKKIYFQGFSLYAGGMSCLTRSATS
jgi:hypothetical protein